MQFHKAQCRTNNSLYNVPSRCHTTHRYVNTDLHNTLSHIHNFRQLPVALIQLHTTRRLVVTQHPVAQINLHVVHYHAHRHAFNSLHNIPLRCQTTCHHA